MSDCDEMKLKVQALADNELEEDQISGVVNHIESCYRCREEYIQFLTLQKKMSGIGIPEPSKEWFEELAGRKFRRVTARLGRFLFFGSYLLLIVYLLYTFFSDSSAALLPRILVGAICAGVAILLGVTIADRVRESKTDKYKEVIK